MQSSQWPVCLWIKTMGKTVSTWECRLPCSLPCSAGSCTYHNYHLQREASEKHEWLVSTAEASTPLYTITGRGGEGGDSWGEEWHAGRGVYKGGCLPWCYILSYMGSTGWVVCIGHWLGSMYGTLAGLYVWDTGWVVSMGHWLGNLYKRIFYVFSFSLFIYLFPFFF